MAVPKIVGMEAEYHVLADWTRRDIAQHDTDSLYIQDHQNLAAAMLDAIHHRVGLARQRDDDVWLANGGRAYLDHGGYLELSTPECANAAQLVTYQDAFDSLMAEAADTVDAARRATGERRTLRVGRRSIDSEGNERGAHENYSFAGANFDEHALASFLTTRLIYSGAGRPPWYDDRRAGGIRLAARQPAPSSILDRTLYLPIQLESGAGWRRIEVRGGDANRAWVAQFLKVGATQFVLAMMEDGLLPGLHIDECDLEPLARTISAGPDNLDCHFRLLDNSPVDPIAHQEQYLDAAHEWAARFGFDAVGGESVGRLVLQWWERVLNDLRSDRVRLVGVLDWVTKEQLFNTHTQRHEVISGDARIHQLDILYHDVRPQSSLFHKLVRAGRMAEVSPRLAVRSARVTPPPGTRAWSRVALIEAGFEIPGGAWSSTGVEPLCEESAPWALTKARVGKALASGDPQRIRAAVEIDVLRAEVEGLIDTYASASPHVLLNRLRKWRNEASAFDDVLDVEPLCSDLARMVEPAVAAAIAELREQAVDATLEVDHDSAIDAYRSAYSPSRLDSLVLAVAVWKLDPAPLDALKAELSRSWARGALDTGRA